MAMKLRDRLLLFSTAQLLTFGAAFAIAYSAFSHSVLPLFAELVRAKTEQAVRTVAAEVDVPLAWGDHARLGSRVAPVVDDPDFVYLVIHDTQHRPVLIRGTAPSASSAPLFDGAEASAVQSGTTVSAWQSISVEGDRLGSAAVVLSTARLASLAVWARRLGLGVALIWFAALIYSLRFAGSFFRPIRAMMDFSRKVAGGALSERLTIAAPGELRELRDYLNQMTADLGRREADRLAAADRTEAMRNELLTVSRMAGMAEIATGVLHNVGNVLNSLNVSVSMISDHVRGSRVSGLCKSIELVDRFPGGLPAFLTTEKGKVLPSYLSTVTKRLTEEHAKVLDELASINRNVDHIKTIVAMQQSYARPGGLKEPVAIAELIDDALRMGESSFARHGIEVIKDYSGELGLLTDRHKLLQIMINLISNARYALKQHHGGSQQLTVRARATDTTLTISVIDTGEGIPAQNLDRIFRHGFTTKLGGHGFGLHASANAARELGGSLRGTSDGPGQGATFTLELPRTGEDQHGARN